MVKSKLDAQGQQGFTLIEIIAVLVILGILAVVAVPRYFNLQDDARQQAIKGIIAAGQSQLSLGYANNKMNSSYTFSNPQTECDKVSVSGNASLNCTGSITGKVVIKGTVDGVSNTANWNNPESTN
ncbi:MAG TPA: prepilin-type N-terminal cleavage/methylation domain-containing protein [Solidesulfovibrio sp.]|nr:prepilin-type cleavage/methylation domain-containing protein [Desulfovibrio sp.]HML60036.1 prepilin-type N-terminal cleavage/methylation domain-containing protein [Solidesulfovibrio sp.]